MKIKTVLSGVLTYGGFAAIWYQAGFIVGIGTFFMVLGFFVWNSKEF